MAKTQGQPAIRINGEMIPYTDSTRILGVIFDNDLKFKKHTDQRMQLAKYTKYKLQRFKILQTKLQLYLYNTLILPQILFSPTPIIYAGKYAFSKIQILQNKILRGIFCIKWDSYIRNQDIHLEHNIEQISSKIYRRFTKQHDKLQANNPIIINRLQRELNGRDSKFTILLANPPDNSLN